MSTLVKWLIMLLVWFAFSWLTFTTCGTQKDTTEEATTSPPTEAPEKRHPVGSKLGEATIDTTDLFQAWKDKILAGMEDGKVLEVEGLYYGSETAPEGAENMGLARATEAMSLLGPYIPEDRMRQVARLVGDAPEEGADVPFLSVATRWMDDEAHVDLEAEEVITISDDERVLLFPNASAREIRVEEVIAYLDELAEHLKNSPEDRVQIVGHASRVGRAEQNVVFSRERANRVQKLLTQRGVSESQIDVSWKGDTQLADPGKTEAAHRRNRRASIKLVRAGD